MLAFENLVCWGSWLINLYIAHWEEVLGVLMAVQRVFSMKSPEGEDTKQKSTLEICHTAAESSPPKHFSLPSRFVGNALLVLSSNCPVIGQRGWHPLGVGCMLRAAGSQQVWPEFGKGLFNQWVNRHFGILIIFQTSMSGSRDIKFLKWTLSLPWQRLESVEKDGWWSKQFQCSVKRTVTWKYKKKIVQTQ